MAACLAYGCLVTLFLRVNSAGEESLRKLVRGHSARHDLIVVTADQDPLLAGNIVRLEEMFDRHVVVVAEPKSASETRPSGTNAAFRLTAAQPAAAGGWLARSEQDDSLAQTLASKPLGWYRRFIARRAASDRLEVGATYYLYKMPE